MNEDAAFKRFFSAPELVEVVARSAVPRWGERVGPATFEPVPTELIGERLARREADMIWLVRPRDGRRPLLLLLEFQARSERHMVLRTTEYAVMAVRATIAASGEEPDAVCVVLHHGEGSWTAPTRLEDLFEAPPPSRYHLISAEPDGGGGASSRRDVIIFGARSVRSRTPGALREELPRLVKALRALGDAELNRVMAERIRDLLASRGYSPKLLEEAMTVDQLQTEWDRGMEAIREEGREEGRAELRAEWDRGMEAIREEGREEGRAAGRRELLCRLAERKFGTAVSARLSDVLEESLDSDRIDDLLAAVFGCASGEQFMARALRGE